MGTKPRSSRPPARRRRLVGSWSIAATVTAAAVAVTAVAMTVSHGNGHRQMVTSARTLTADEVRGFYQNAKKSLSPLLIHVRQIPTTLAAVSHGDSRPGGGLTSLAASWADDCATARDLVSRLPAPEGPVGSTVKDLYETAAMLDGEAARILSETPDIEDPQLRRAASTAGSRLYLLGDRVFDIAERTLNQGGAVLQGELVYPAAVPDFKAEGLDPDQPGAPRPDRSGMLNNNPVTGDWYSAVRKPVAEAERDLKATGRSYGAASAPNLKAVSLDLDRLQAQMAAPVPAAENGREGVVAIRLAMVVVGESLRPQGAGPVNAERAARLRLIGERLWASGATLLRTAAAVPSNALALSPAGLSQPLLWQGGVFNGHPPVLLPGQDPGTGVPGGLPALNPLQIFGGVG
jgi:hypothetical protein